MVIYCRELFNMDCESSELEDLFVMIVLLNQSLQMVFLVLEVLNDQR